jgi:uncharacterized protein YneF (UPF0154 family)
MKNHYKFWIILSFLIVFVAGIFGGVFLQDKVLDTKTEKTSRSSRKSSVHFPTLDDMAAELGLNSSQKEQIREIFQNNEKRLREFRGKIHGQYSDLRTQLLIYIKSALTAEQTEKFDGMINRYMSQRKEAQEKRRSHSKNSSDKKE